MGGRRKRHRRSRGWVGARPYRKPHEAAIRVRIRTSRANPRALVSTSLLPRSLATRRRGSRSWAPPLAHQHPRLAWKQALLQLQHREPVLVHQPLEQGRELPQLHHGRLLELLRHLRAHRRRQEIAEDAHALSFVWGDRARGGGHAGVKVECAEGGSSKGSCSRLGDPTCVGNGTPEA